MWFDERGVPHLQSPARISEWSGLAELTERNKTLSAQKSELDKQFEEMLENKAISEEQEKIKKSGLTEQEYFRKEAVNEFGYTSYFYDAGWDIIFYML